MNFYLHRSIAALFCLMTMIVTCTEMSQFVHAHDHGPAPKAVPNEVTYRSTAMPERILLGWKGDTSTSQAVTWRTDTSVKHCFAQIAVAEDGPLFVAKAKAAQVEGKTTLVETDLGERNYHAVNFTGLEPDTLYVYRVGDRTNWSAWMHFRTAHADFQPFSFVYFGDAQNSLKEHWSRVFREAYADAPRAGFMLHAGDLVNRGPSDYEWGEWCAAGGWVNGTIPTIAIPGNHEYFKIYANPNVKDDNYTEHLVRRWDERFEFPENGPKELLESCYYLDYQGVRIVGLNSMEDFELQAKWLESALADNPCRWTVVTHHHPVFSGKANRDNPELRDAWQPIYDKYKVDLVLTGHDHSYARTGLTGYQKNIPTGVRAQSKKGGTVYVVSVSGPKQYDSSADYPFVRRAEDTQLYQVISVEKDQIKYEAKTAVGKLYDAFTLKKREGQTNELVEQVPDVPENFRDEK